MEFSKKDLVNSENIFDTGFRLFNTLIGILLAFEFSHDITTL